MNQEVVSKRVRLQDDKASNEVGLRVIDIIKFYFDESIEGVCPQFVHQNFDSDGLLNCPKSHLPLSIGVHVNTKDLTARLSFSHEGSSEDLAFRACVSEIVSRLTTACDLGNGCKPAVYPNGFGVDSLTSPLISPSELFTLPNGSTVEKYSASTLGGKSLDIWKRAEWLMLWNIESVTQSDHEHDTNWEYYFLRDTLGNIEAMCSVYKFPSFTLLSESNVIGERLRLSQFLTIPTKWNSGAGSRLLNFLAEYVINRKDIDMLSMEDPSFGMTSMRESVYLTLARKNNIVNADSPEMIAQRLKIPKSFAKRILSLLEMEKIRKGRPVSDKLIQEVVQSGNKLVNKFIDKIEFYEDEDDDPNAPLSEEKSNKLINVTIQNALLKLEKVMANGA